MLSVKDVAPNHTYAWYETRESSTALSITSILSNVTVSQNRSYFLAVTSCSTTRFEIPVVIKRIDITVNGVTPTGPVRLSYGAPLVLRAQTNPSSAGPYTWLLNGVTIAGQTGVQLSVNTAGRYTVRIPGTGPSYESRPMEVSDPLAGQSVNDQALTYVSTLQVLQRNVTGAEQIPGLSAEARSQTVSYVNGLGQPLQQIAVQAGPGQQDMVQHFAYTGLPTAAQIYLPVPVTGQAKSSALYESDALSKISAYYATKGGQPYATTTTETSPLGRPLAQTQTGTAWIGHDNTVAYQANTAQEVRFWQEYNGTQFYPTGQLRKEILTDADGRQTELFKDLFDRIVLERKVTGSGTSRKTYDTYNVYAETGYLQRIIPPAAVEAMAAANQWNIQSMPAAFKDQWLYEYTYDKGRLVERKFPGAATVHIVYDRYDRPILVQDGNRYKQFGVVLHQIRCSEPPGGGRYLG